MSAAITSGGLKAKCVASRVQRIAFRARAGGVTTVTGVGSVRWAIADRRRACAAPTLRRGLGLSACQLDVEASIDRQCGAAPAEGELETPTRADQARGHIHQLLHDGAQASPLGLAAWWCVGAEQSDPALCSIRTLMKISELGHGLAD